MLAHFILVFAECHSLQTWLWGPTENQDDRVSGRVLQRFCLSCTLRVVWSPICPMNHCGTLWQCSVLYFISSSRRSSHDSGDSGVPRGPQALLTSHGLKAGKVGTCDNVHTKIDIRSTLRKNKTHTTITFFSRFRSCETPSCTLSPAPLSS